MPQATFGVVDARKIQEGETNGRTWALYEVKGSDGKRYTSFDSAWLLMVGKSVTAEYKVVQKGKYVNYSLGDAPNDSPSSNAPIAAKTSSTPPAPATHQASGSAETLNRILSTLERIARHLGVPE